MCNAGLLQRAVREPAPLQEEQLNAVPITIFHGHHLSGIQLVGVLASREKFSNKLLLKDRMPRNGNSSVFNSERIPSHNQRVLLSDN